MTVFESIKFAASMMFIVFLVLVVLALIITIMSKSVSFLEKTKEEKDNLKK